MEKLTIQDLRDRGWIAYEYVRGSHAYGLNTETSDKDIGGVFICPPEMLMGLRSNYIEQVADETNDTVFYEFGRWVELLLKANPTALESLFIHKHCIIGDVHPMVQHIINNRDKFLSIPKKESDSHPLFPNKMQRQILFPQMHKRELFQYRALHP